MHVSSLHKTAETIREANSMREIDALLCLSYCIYIYWVIAHQHYTLAIRTLSFLAPCIALSFHREPIRCGTLHCDRWFNWTKHKKGWYILCMASHWRAINGWFDELSSLLWDQGAALMEYSYPASSDAVYVKQAGSNQFNKLQARIDWDILKSFISC